MDQEDKTEKKEDVVICSAWSPDDGIVLEWMGRAEGISDEQ